MENSISIQAPTGVLTLQQLTEDIEMDPKTAGLAQLLYDMGLEQFNHYVNNRDGVIEESRRKMVKLQKSLSQSEVSLSENIGVSLAAYRNQEQRQSAEVQFDNLGPLAQAYAQWKRREYEAEQRVARDLEKDVPGTDYTSVKTRIASGTVTLDSITSELPIPWQEIRTIDKKVETPTGKPPKREFLHTIFVTDDRGMLEDKKAEKDGDWIISDKHDMVVPYQEPIPHHKHIYPGRPPVRVGEVVVINRNPTSEWDCDNQTWASSARA